MNPARFASFLSHLLLIVFVSMVQGGSGISSTRSRVTVCAEGSCQLFRSTPGAQKYRQQRSSTPTDSWFCSRANPPSSTRLKAVWSEDNLDQEGLVALHAPAFTGIGANPGGRGLPSAARRAGEANYAQRSGVASVLATGPPFGGA